MRTFIPLALLLVLPAPAATDPVPSAVKALRICSDPNNLPFSNERQEGFENKIAALIGAEMHVPVTYWWASQRKNFVRNTLNAGKCDAVMGIPQGFGGVITTHPYYRSTYVWVTRKQRNIAVKSFDDPLLRTLRIGVHVTDDNFAPPAQALARRGLINNLKGYSLLGVYGEVNPPARLIDAVEKNQVDVALAWGPLVGYFVRLQTAPLRMTPVSPDHDGPIPFAFAISAAVRSRDTNLLAAIERALEARRTQVQRILTEFGVPQV